MSIASVWLATALLSTSCVLYVIFQVTGNHQAFGFVEFRSEEDCEYAIKVSVGIVRPEESLCAPVQIPNTRCLGRS